MKWTELICLYSSPRKSEKAGNIEMLIDVVLQINYIILVYIFMHVITLRFTDSDSLEMLSTGFLFIGISIHRMGMDTG